ncbi:MAG: AmmeMemoRadiSam system protein B [Clostridia bacterium]|nr:MAG: AmmeMemoRadiSam system protein B [Clostridia bacterium]
MSWFDPYHVASASLKSARPPAVAGAFYPARPAQLQAAVDDYIQSADLPPLKGEVRAVIAPHAGYVYSGPIAGHSFRALAPLPENATVFLMGPAHYVPVPEVALGYFRTIETPLGAIPVDDKIVQELAESASCLRIQNEAHMPEHSLEVELPFLQRIASDNFTVVPMLFGQPDGECVARALLPYIADHPQARIVVSSDLSHYHPYRTAQQLDTAFLDAVLQGDTVAAARGEACGRFPILALMLLAETLGWTPHLLDYRNSGDTAGDKRQVVGYASIAYTEE